MALSKNDGADSEPYVFRTIHHRKRVNINVELIFFDQKCHSRRLVYNFQHFTHCPPLNRQNPQNAIRFINGTVKYDNYKNLAIIGRVES